MVKIQFDPRKLARLLSCPVKEVRFYPEDKELVIQIEEGCCVDMVSVINYAMTVSSEIKQIQTVYKNSIDTCYAKIDGYWKIIPAVRYAVLRNKA